MSPPHRNDWARRISELWIISSSIMFVWQQRKNEAFNIKGRFKNRLQIETYQPLQSKADVVIIDGCGKLWSISWPNKATLRDLAHQMYQHVTFLQAADDMDVFFVFARYFKYSIKVTTREERTENLANNHVLTLDAPLSSGEIAMASSENKIQAIDIISKYIVDRLAANHLKNRLVLTHLLKLCPHRFKKEWLFQEMT